MVTIRIPVPPMLVSNLLGLLGVVGLLVAVAALTDWRWSLLVGSAGAVALSYVASVAARPARPKAVPNVVSHRRGAKAAA